MYTPHHHPTVRRLTTVLASLVVWAQCATADPWTQNNLPPDLVAWWQGEGNFSDLVGTSPGSAGPDVSFTSGKVGSAFRFINTSNSSIHFPNSPGFSPANRQLTITAWIKPDFAASNAIDTILEKRDPGIGNEPYSFIFAVLKDYPGYPKGVFGLGMLPQIPFIHSTTRIPDDGRFHHVAVTYNGNKATGNCVLYMDGQVVGGGNGAGSIPVTGSGPYMGMQRFMPSGLSNDCSMAIDEIGFFGRELGAPEIAYLKAGPDLPVTQGLKLHLDAGNANGDGSNPASGAFVTTWRDLSGSGLDATPPLFPATTCDAPVYRTGVLNNRAGVDFGPSGSDALATAVSDQLNFTTGTIIMVGNGSNTGTHVSISAPLVMQEFCIFDQGIQHHSSPLHYTYRSHQSAPGSYYVHAARFGVSAGQLDSLINGVASTGGLVFGQQSPTLDDVADYLPVARQAILGWRNSDAYGNAPSAGENFAGVICEVLVYDRQLSGSEVDGVSLFLSNKYGIPVAPLPPVLRMEAAAGGTAPLEWDSALGRHYQIQSSTSLAPTSWVDEGVPFIGTGGVLSTNVPTGPEPGKVFRLQLSGN